MNTLYLILAVIAFLLALGCTLTAGTAGRPLNRIGLALVYLGFAVMCLAVVEAVRAAKAL